MESVISEMEESRSLVHAAIRGIDTSAVDVPLAPGKWSVREHLLHLHAWDALALDAFEFALDGVEAKWAHFDPDETNRLNEERLAPLRATPWLETLRLLDEGRDRLMEAIADIPVPRAELWEKDHALGAMLLDLAWNDAHHAEIIRHWRAERGG
jgi:hypothetical protein